MAREGGESPPPETQTGKQLQDPPAKEPNYSDNPSEGAQDDSKNTLDNLESNPEHILAKSAEDKTSKKKYVH